MSEHYAVIRPAGRHYKVFFAGELVVESDDVLELEEHFGEKTAPKVPYFPAVVLDSLGLKDSATTSTCPLKGQARYWSFRGVKDAVWSYPDAKDAVSEVAGFVAFDAAKGFRIEADG